MVSVVLLPAAAGLQGGPPSPGCRFELGHKEGRSSPAGLHHGARPAPAANAELAFTQESFGEEESTARGTAEPQTSQTRPRVAPPEARFAEENAGVCCQETTSACHFTAYILLYLLPSRMLF